LGMHLRLLKIGSVDIASNVKCSPKTIQETAREFNVESRLPKSESSAFTTTLSFL